MTVDSSSSFSPPATVVEIARTLTDAGFETWCVGGAVRDALLGLTNLDWDIATAALPTQVQKLFRRTVPVGIMFGTVGVLDRHGVMHEVTTFRRDVSTDGRHAVVEFGASLDEDLARRDFTVNAIAFDPIGRRLHDPFAGRADLASGIIRAVGDAEERMREDRLRALRAIRFAARFDFEFDPATWTAVVASAPYLGRLSPERVKQEIEKTLDQTERPSQAFSRWREAGAFESVVPALAAVSDRSLAAIDCLAKPGLRGRPGRRALRLAALFGDTDGNSAERALRALRFSNQDTAWVSGLVQRWAQFGAALTSEVVDADSVPPDASLRRLASRIGRLRVAAFMRLAAAHWAVLPEATRPSASTVRALHRRLVRVAFHDAIEAGDLAVDGDDLRAAGIPAGPALGRLLAMLLAEVIETPSLNERTQLLSRAHALRDMALPRGD